MLDNPESSDLNAGEINRLSPAEKLHLVYLSDRSDNTHSWQAMADQMVFDVDTDGMSADAEACFARNQESVELRLYGNYRCDTKLITEGKEKKPFMRHNCIHRRETL